MANSKVLKPRRGSTAEHSTFKGQAFEITFDTDKKTIVAHDGLTMGGFPLAHEAALSEADNALRTLIDQKVSEVEGVSSNELRSLESALRGLINNNAQQQVMRDADQDNVIAVLNSTLRALIAEEVAKAMATANTAKDSASAAQSVADAALPRNGSKAMYGDVDFSGGGKLSRLANGSLALIATNAKGDMGAQVQVAPYDIDSDAIAGAVSLVTRKADGTLGPYLRLHPTSSPEWDNAPLPLTLNGAKASPAGDLSDINSSGTNWIRFSNGLQIVFVVVSASTTSFTHTFPKAFSQTPSIQAISSGKNRNAVQGGSATGFTFADDGSGGAKTHYILAVGKWK